MGRMQGMQWVQEPKQQKERNQSVGGCGEAGSSREGYV